MADTVGDHIVETISTTQDLVTERFSQAKGYASEFASDTTSFLDNLANLVVEATMPVPDIHFDWQPLSIVSDIELKRPNEPSDTEFNSPDLPSNGVEELPLFTEANYQSDVNLAIYAKLLYDVVNGGTGLGATVEAALWDRATARKELINEQTYLEAEEYYSSRGWSMPPGALNSNITRARAEIAREQNDINSDILYKQADLAVNNTHFIMTSALQLEGVMINFFGDKAKRKLDYDVARNESKIKKFATDVDLFKSAVMAESARIDGISKIFMAKVDEYKADSMVNSASLDAQVKIFDARIQEAKNYTDILLKEAEIALVNAMHYYGIQVEAAKAGASVAAQIAASALSSVSASAQVGYHATSDENVGNAYSHDMTKDTPTTQTIYQHNISETGG
jgi:hypothetical protein